MSIYIHTYLYAHSISEWMHSYMYTNKHTYIYTDSHMIGSVHLWCDILKYVKFNHSVSDQLLNKWHLSSQSLQLLQLNMLRDKIWMIFDQKMWRRMTFSLYLPGSCDDTCWNTLCWTAITRRCVNYVVTLLKRSLWTHSVGANHLLNTYRWIWSRRSLHLAVGDRRGS